MSSPLASPSPAAVSSTTPPPLAPSLVERVLEKLGLNQRPEATPAGLAACYAAWCQQVPFDNVRKLIYLNGGDPGCGSGSGLLPGSDPTDFLEAWLQHGTGGTCWAGSTAMHALLTALGFQARRGIATMMAAPDLPPNHGTVVVEFRESRQLIDTSILCGEPLILDLARPIQVTHPAWGLRGEFREGRWQLDWRPMHKPEGIVCRLERFHGRAEEFLDYHEQTRPWSPFNYEATARRNRGEEVTGIAFGNAITLHADGSITSEPFGTTENRNRILIERVGLSEEIVAQLPPDRPTPPPPGSHAAAEAAAAAAAMAD